MTKELISKEQFIKLKSLLQSMVRCSTREDVQFCKIYKEEIEAFLKEFTS